MYPWWHPHARLKNRYSLPDGMLQTLIELIGHERSTPCIEDSIEIAHSLSGVVQHIVEHQSDHQVARKGIWFDVVDIEDKGSLGPSLKFVACNSC